MTFTLYDLTQNGVNSLLRWSSLCKYLTMSVTATRAHSRWRFYAVSHADGGELVVSLSLSLFVWRAHRWFSNFFLPLNPHYVCVITACLTGSESSSPFTLLLLPPFTLLLLLPVTNGWLNSQWTGIWCSNWTLRKTRVVWPLQGRRGGYYSCPLPTICSIDCGNIKRKWCEKMNIEEMFHVKKNNVLLLYTVGHFSALRKKEKGYVFPAWLTVPC